MDEVILQQMLEKQSDDLRVMLAVQTEEMKRHNGILFEHFDDKIKVVTEVVGLMHEKLTVVAEDVDELKTRMGGVEDRLDRVEQKVDNLEQKVDDLDKKVDDLDKKVDDLDKKVDDLDKKVDGLDKKVDILDERVSNVEKKLDSVAADVVEIKQNLTSKVDIASHLALEHRVEKLETIT